MSRRYGRNQRRAAREALAKAHGVNAALQGERRDLIDKAQRAERQLARMQGEMEEWASRIVALLGDDTAFARDMPTKFVESGLWQALLDGRPFLLSPTEPLRPMMRDPMPLSIARRVVEAFIVLAGYDTDVTRYQRRFLVSVPGREGAYALAMDERTLQRLRGIGDTGLQRYLLEQLVLPWSRYDLDTKRRRA